MMGKRFKGQKDIPLDIIIDILSRLRVKTLCRLRCVSKSWETLISDPIFIRTHTLHSKQHPLIFTIKIEKETTNKEACCCSVDMNGNLINKFMLPFATSNEFLSVSTCLNLVCLYDDTQVYVCNPAIEKITVLPPKAARFWEQHCVAFGYVPSTNKFKVLNICCRDARNFLSQSCEILTLGTDKGWRAVKDPPFPVINIPLKPEVAFAEGAIHLIPTCHNDFFETGIARFDLEQEEWSVLPPPPMPNFLIGDEDIGYFMHFSEVGGRLCLMYGDAEDMVNSDRFIINLWVLKDYSKGLWVKACDITLSPSEYLVASHGTMLPILVEENKSILMNFSSNKLLYFDSNGKKCKEIIVGERPIVASVYEENFYLLG